MDPYLETPDLWPDVHHQLIGEIHATLNRLLRPRYIARIQHRFYVPDEDGVRFIDEIEEARLEIRHRESKALVTVIEVLSPANKIRGSRGRGSFMEKRRDTLASDVHWVEIDLLRSGHPSVTRPPLVPSDYRIMVSRAGERTRAKYWPVGVRQPLPVIGIPLRGKDPDVPLDLGAVLSAAYDHGAYDLSVDYRREPDPPPCSASRDCAAAERTAGDGRRRARCGAAPRTRATSAPSRASSASTSVSSACCVWRTRCGR
jgi:hypothetical protein